ncbi:type I DNA topoisomerase [Geitlerinema sp. PCC 9228]|jgi:DNA topoisomerase-1|uniref:type I DNA topoisomerase n=1 Tax=Geitlerinema sp. PCC 9228 TaxID=111611 RepID=UPI0008F9995E|nr:type I DNA topoisomerase [Geitlerinema sp. PCC 9228]
MSTLVIVESPTKARTIRNYLPNEYQVEASMGHVRDLPQSAKEIPSQYKGQKWAQLGVNVEGNFEPLYVIPKDKKKTVKQLQESLQQADELILATDEDREGESISWHLLQVLQPEVPTKRMVFHEITQEAIRNALQECRHVDENLVRAQETRRILDRLVGYTVSPLLWKKIAPGLSAGRVQSVAVRLVVERERQRRAFRSGSYWDLKATLQSPSSAKGKSATFEAKLVTLGGKRLASGNDFDPRTGDIAQGRDVVRLLEADAAALRDRLADRPWEVTSVEERASKRRPSPPFTTSTLQQESNRKLNMGARETMRVAQSLYEQGYITYMRTDSVHLSQQAIAAARQCVENKYGKKYLSPKPRQYSTKSKNAQEAHEAIRPAGSTFRTPAETGLAGKERKLYDLIWKRTVASQMADAQQTNITVALQVEDAGFQATGKRIDFPGFLRAYVEGSDDPEAALEDREVILPPLQQGDRPECQEIETVSHETKPPARYTEASLVKTLESEGIGRPSTYASIIGTIVDRGYIYLSKNTLIPTFTAFAVSSLLEEYFPDLVDTGFTARMEATLDKISTGDAEWLPYLDNFYRGEKGLAKQVEQQESRIDPSSARTVELEDLDATIRIGKFGPYVEAEANGDGPVNASLPRDIPPADIDKEQVEKIVKQKTEGPEKLTTHPETGEPVYVLVGPYGPYVQLGDGDEKTKPKRVSLPKGTATQDVTPEMALKWLALPRDLGTHPDQGGKIQAGIGRYGPYVVHHGEEGKTYASLRAGDDVLTVELPRAVELINAAQLRKSKRKQSGKNNQKSSQSSKTSQTTSKKSQQKWRELGKHPEDGKPVKLFDQEEDAFYVKHSRTSVALPEGETADTISLEKAIELIEEKKAAKGKSTRKSTAKKSTSSKSKKSTASKSTKAKSG